VLAGNIRDGIGIADRIKQGKTIASEIINLNHEE
jgi:oxygen-dependent protoporphyrinogen oxidase